MCVCGSAIAQAGKSVLHIDPGAHYGTHWAGLHLDQFLDWAASLQHESRSDAAVIGHTAPEPPSVDSLPQFATSTCQSDTFIVCPLFIAYYFASVLMLVCFETQGVD